MSEASTETLEARHVSRRNVLRVGAAAAWSVPIVQVVTAAPAAAACSTNPCAPGSGTLELAVSGSSTGWATTGSGSNKKYLLPVSATLTNNGTATTTEISVTIAFENGWAPTVATPPDSTQWATGQKLNVGSQSWTFTAVRQISGKGTTDPLNVTFTPSSPSNNGKAVTLTLGGNAKSGSSLSATAPSTTVAVSKL